MNRIESFFPLTEPWFRTLVENSPMGIGLLKGKNFIYMNRELQRMFGPETHIDSFDDLLTYPEDLKRHEQICRAIEQNKALQTDVELRFYPNQEARQQNDLQHVVVRTDTLSHRSETVTLLNMTNVTYSKRMEHLALLKSKMESLGRISVGIAHEIRSPLTGIDFLLQGIRDISEQTEAREEIRPLLEQVEKAIEKIETVVKRVLDFANPSEPQIRQGSIHQPLQSSLDLLKPSIRKADIDLQLDLDDKLPDLFIDVHLMEQVFLNLINNAITAVKAVDKKRIIGVNTRQSRNDIIVEVFDSGEGIPEQLYTRIFDPFFTTKKSGTGIGLSICQRIITDHGGTLTIARSAHGGAQINIRLPIEKRQFKR